MVCDDEPFSATTTTTMSQSASMYEAPKWMSGPKMSQICMALVAASPSFGAAVCYFVIAEKGASNPAKFLATLADECSFGMPGIPAADRTAISHAMRPFINELCYGLDHHVLDVLLPYYNLDVLMGRVSSPADLASGAARDLVGPEILTDYVDFMALLDVRTDAGVATLSLPEQHALLCAEMSIDRLVEKRRIAREDEFARLKGDHNNQLMELRSSIRAVCVSCGVVSPKRRRCLPLRG